MNQTIKKSFAISSIGFLLSLSLAPFAIAEEVKIEVTGNGAASENTASVNDSSTTNVESSNNATINNNITTNANTGNNSADFNTGGDTTIVTGDVKTDTAVSNTANTSVVDVGCGNCHSSGTTAVISGNGAKSDNTVSVNNSNNTSVDIYNNADVTNNVKTYANTGKNSADFNTGGDTVIKTGNIKANTTIFNSPLNVAKVKVAGQNGNGETLFKITGNGVFSDNVIYADNENNVDINVTNVADLINNVKNYLNTGDNHADFNTGGDVVIKTGDIVSDVLIKNLANISIVEVVCACDKEKPQKPREEAPQPSAPTTTTTSVGGPSNPTSSAPQAVLAAMLPVTGNNALFFLLLANILMFFLGAYLRLRSGRSPSYSFSL